MTKWNSTNSLSDHTYSSLYHIKGCYKEKKKKTPKNQTPTKQPETVKEKKKYFLKITRFCRLAKWCIIAEGTAYYCYSHLFLHRNTSSGTRSV